jgi:hypothetical protein
MEFETSVDDIIFQKRMANKSFPQSISRGLCCGFHDEMEALQGVDNGYYVGGQYSFATTFLTSQFSRGGLQYE